MTYELVAVARTPQVSGPPTLSEVDQIAAPTINWSHELSLPGTLRFSCTTDRLPGEVKSRFRDLAANPTEVWLHRDGVRVFAANVQAGQVQGNTLSVYGVGLLGYLAYMAVVSDLTYSGVDQHLIAKALVDQWQTLDYGHYGIDTSAITASGTTRDRTYVAAEQHEVLRRILDLAAVNNGFDIDVDPSTRELLLYHPSQGADLSSSVVLDGRNITDANVAFSVAPGTIASEAFGSGTGETTITSTQSNTSLRATWGRAAVFGTFDGVSQQATLDGHTSRLLNERDAMLFQPGPGLHPVADADVDSFDVGDTVTYDFDSGLGRQTGTYRVAVKQVTVDEVGQESIAVAFT